MWSITPEQSGRSNSIARHNAKLKLRLSDIKTLRLIMRSPAIELLSGADGRRPRETAFPRQETAGPKSAHPPHLSPPQTALRMSATTRSAISDPRGGMRDGRVLSRRRPCGPPGESASSGLACRLPDWKRRHRGVRSEIFRDASRKADACGMCTCRRRDTGFRRFRFSLVSNCSTSTVTIPDGTI